MVGCVRWPLSHGGSWQGVPSPVLGHVRVAPLSWWVIAGCPLYCGGMWQGAPSPVAGHGMEPPLSWPHGGMCWVSPLPWWVMAGCPLSRDGSWQGAASPVALWWDVAWIPLSRGGMLHGATSLEDRASPVCWHGLCPTRLHVAVPCLSPLPAHFCPARNTPATALSSAPWGWNPLG